MTSTRSSHSSIEPPEMRSMRQNLAPSLVVVGAEGYLDRDVVVKNLLELTK